MAFSVDDFAPPTVPKARLRRHRTRRSRERATAARATRQEHNQLGRPAGPPVDFELGVCSQAEHGLDGGEFRGELSADHVDRLAIDVQLPRDLLQEV